MIYSIDYKYVQIKLAQTPFYQQRIIVMQNGVNKTNMLIVRIFVKMIIFGSKADNQTWV